MSNHGVGRLARLQEHLAALVGTPGTPGHLLQHVEGSLATAKVGETNHRVGIENAHHAHSVEVQPLGDHLCSHQHISLV